MEYNNYLKYIKSTVDEYPMKLKSHLVRMFEENAIIIRDQNKIMQVSFDNLEVKNVAGLDIKAQIATCLESGKKAISLFEEWEFLKDYRYSVLFDINDFDSCIDNIRQTKSVNEADACFVFDGNFKDPVHFEDEDALYLKFNLLYSCFIERANEMPIDLYLKYPFLVVFHKRYKIVEFRFDTLKRIFLNDRKDNFLYSRLIDQMIAYLSITYNCVLENIDLSFLVQLFQENTNPAVKLIHQSMRLRDGGEAELGVGNNEKFRIPLIDDLKLLMYDFEKDLDIVPDLKNALNEFLNEIINNSDYPFIRFLLIGKNLSHDNKVNITFNYNSRQYSLIQHMFSQSLIGMERMNDVTEYIIKSRGNSER